MSSILKWDFKINDGKSYMISKVDFNYYSNEVLCCREKIIYLIDLNTGLELRRFVSPDIVNICSFTPDGKNIIYTNDSTFKGYYDPNHIDNNNICMINSITGEEVWSENYNLMFTDFSVSEDGVIVALGRMGNQDSTIFMLNPVTGKILWQKILKYFAISITFSPNRKFIAYILPKINIEMIDGKRYVVERHYIYMINSDNGEDIWNNNNIENANKIAFSPDGNYILCSKDSQKIFSLDVKNGNKLWSINDYDIISLSISHNSEHIICGGLVSIKIIHAKTSEILWVNSDYKIVRTIHYSPDNSRIIFVSGNNLNCIMNPLYRKPLKSAKNNTCK